MSIYLVELENKAYTRKKKKAEARNMKMMSIKSALPAHTQHSAALSMYVTE